MSAPHDNGNDKVNTPCGAPDCTASVWQAGLCTAHYQQRRRGRPFTRPQASPGQGSSIDLRVDLSLLSLVDMLSRQEGITRAEWIRRAIRERAERMV